MRQTKTLWDFYKTILENIRINDVKKFVFINMCKIHVKNNIGDKMLKVWWFARIFLKQLYFIV